MFLAFDHIVKPVISFALVSTFLAFLFLLLFICNYYYFVNDY